MADITVKATLSGVSEARAAVQGLGRSIEDLTEKERERAVIDENLKRIGAEHTAQIKAQAEALQSLKANTADAVQKFRDQEAAEQFASSALGKMTGLVGSFAASWISAGAVVGGAIKLLKDIDAAGRENAETTLRLNAILAATGGVVGKTSTQLEEMADAMQAATRFDNNAVERAQSIMLTFSKVTGDVFTRGMALAADYSELLGTDLSTSARLLGRALNDPVNGLGMLSRTIGQLDPETKDLIKTFQENGDTLGAQTVLVEALEKKFGGLAKTMGGSAVVAVDKLRNAWSNLLQELAKTPDDPTGSKGLFGENLAIAAKRIDTIKGWVIDFNTWRHDNEVKILTRIVNAENTSFQERAAAQKRLTEITKNEGANREKAEADALAKEAEARKKTDEDALWQQVARDDKMADEWLKHQAEKTKAAQKAAEERRKIERETYDQSVKNRQIDLENYLAVIDAQLATTRKGSAEEVTLMKTRHQIWEEIFKREDDLRKQKEAQDAQELKDQKELQDLMKSRAEEEIAHLETLNIKNGNLVKLEGDDRIRALQALARKYAEMGDIGVGAYLKIQSEIRKTRTTAEEDFDRMRQVFGRVTFDMTGQFSNLHQSVQSNLADMMKGNQSAADGIKGIFKNMVDSVINEFARLAANDILSGVMQMLGLSSGRTGGSLLGGLLGGGGGRGGGVGNVSMVRNLFSGVGDAADFAGGYAAIEGLSTAEAAALIESGTVGFAGAGMESAALGVGMAEGAASFIPYVGWAMLASKALGIDVGSAFSSVLGGVGDVVSGIGSVAGDIFSGIGDIFGFATGGESVVTRPSLISVGESGAERVRVTPMAGGNQPSGGITNVFQGPVIMDEYSMRLWQRQQARQMRG